MKKYIFVAIILFFPISNTLAEIYKWVDENNQVHYGSRPPENKTATKIKPPPPPSSSAQDEIKALENQTLEEKEQEQKQLEQNAQQQKIDDFNQAKKINCERAKAKLKALIEKPIIRTYDDKGSNRVMDENEVAKQIIEAKKAINTHCTQEPATTTTTTTTKQTEETL